MATVSFRYLPKDDTNIEVRFNYKEGDKYKYSKTGIYIEGITSKFWDDYKDGVSFRDEEKANLKTTIDDRYNELKEVILSRYSETDRIGRDWLKNVVFDFDNPTKTEDAIPNTLGGYWGYYLKLTGHKIKPRTLQKIEGVKRKFEVFQKKQNKSYLVKDVNEQFVKDWLDYFTALDYDKSTIAKYLSYIKTVCNHAATKGVEVSPELPKVRINPKVRIKGKSKPLPKIYLSFEELEKIQALRDLPEYLDNARDWLVISCFTGQRVSDFMRFNTAMIRVTKGKRFIDLKQQKGEKEVSIPILPEVEVILNKRDGDFPRSTSHQRYNDYIKEVCRLAGITNEMRGKVRMTISGRLRGVIDIYPKFKLIASHCGRRSFATNYYGKVSNVYLMNITGHTKEETFLKYIGKTHKDTSLEAFDLLKNVRK